MAGTYIGVDAGKLGRPDTFDVTGAKWVDGRAVLIAYAGLCSIILAGFIPTAKANEEHIAHGGLGAEAVVASTSLCYMLVLPTRGEPLNFVVDSGVGEGLSAWMGVQPCGGQRGGDSSSRATST